MQLQLNDILQQVCKKENIVDYAIEVHGGNKVGEGFLGEITFLTLTDKTSGIEYNLVVKKAFETEKQRARHQVRDCFIREIYLYTTVWPKFVELQNEQLLDYNNDVFNKIVKCFATSTEDKNEYLILENGKKLGYNLVSKEFVLDSLHLELIFRNYAQFHSFSYLMKQKKPSVFQELQSNIPNIFMKVFDNKESAMYAEHMFVLAKKSLQPQDDKELIESKLDKCIENWRDYFSDSYYENAKFKAIVHGDCWSNNMMFKYDDNGKPKDIKLIDWQLSHYGSPICDLSYCLYSGSNKAQYDQLDKYLKIYHETFINNLEKLKYDFSKNPVPTLSDLKEEWKKYCKFGFAMGLMLIRMKAMSEEEVTKIIDSNAETEIKSEEKLTDEKLNNRFRGLVLHMNQIGAL